MPITRHGLATSSITRKLWSYSSAFDAGLFKQSGMTPAPRVLFVTTTKERAGRMVEACQAHADARHATRFRFTDHATLQSCTSLYDECWIDGAGTARPIFG